MRYNWHSKKLRDKQIELKRRAKSDYKRFFRKNKIKQREHLKVLKYLKIDKHSAVFVNEGKVMVIHLDLTWVLHRNNEITRVALFDALKESCKFYVDFRNYSNTFNRVYVDFKRFNYFYKRWFLCVDLLDETEYDRYVKRCPQHKKVIDEIHREIHFYSGMRLISKGKSKIKALSEEIKNSYNIGSIDNDYYVSCEKIEEDKSVWDYRY